MILSFSESSTCESMNHSTNEKLVYHSNEHPDLLQETKHEITGWYTLATCSPTMTCRKKMQSHKKERI